MKLFFPLGATRRPKPGRVLSHKSYLRTPGGAESTTLLVSFARRGSFDITLTHLVTGW
jgi:hypothetical protein